MLQCQLAPCCILQCTLLQVVASCDASVRAAGGKAHAGISSWACTHAFISSSTCRVSPHPSISSSTYLPKHSNRLHLARPSNWHNRTYTTTCPYAEQCSHTSVPCLAFLNSSVLSPFLPPLTPSILSCILLPTPRATASPPPTGAALKEQPRGEQPTIEGPTIEPLKSNREASSQQSSRRPTLQLFLATARSQPNNLNRLLTSEGHSPDEDNFTCPKPMRLTLNPKPYRSPARGIFLTTFLSGRPASPILRTHQHRHAMPCTSPRAPCQRNTRHQRNTRNTRQRNTCQRNTRHLAFVRALHLRHLSRPSLHTNHTQLLACLLACLLARSLARSLAPCHLPGTLATNVTSGGSVGYLESNLKLSLNFSSLGVCA
jgi:hypothetical protein